MRRPRGSDPRLFPLVAAPVMGLLAVGEAQLDETFRPDLVPLSLVTERWQVYFAFALMSVGWATMSGAAINIIVAPWFDKRRGLAVSWALKLMADG